MNGGGKAVVRRRLFNDTHTVVYVRVCVRVHVSVRVRMVYTTIRVNA